LESSSSELPDPVDDGTHTTQQDWPSCEAPVRLLKIVGGGHAWAGGWQYLGVRTIGPVAQDFSATEALFDFFEGR
jgi:polyhydroxybutyrate depolymerase